MIKAVFATKNKMSNIKINKHSSIRIEDGKVLYFDPFQIEDASFDADLVFITHEHYDHFEPKSMEKISKSDTIFIVPLVMKDKMIQAGFDEDWCEFMSPGDEIEIGEDDEIKIKAVHSYNTDKPNHLKEYDWLGYIVSLGGTSYYVAGDTDDNEDIRKVVCDVALVPVGGTYTMDAKQAANFVATINPKVAIPTHYGSIVGNANDGEKFKEHLQKINKEIKCEILI